MSRRVVYWVGASVYLAVVALAVVLTGPTVIRGADGLEIGPLLLLGLPSSIVLIIVGGWGMLPFGDTASDWAPSWASWQAAWSTYSLIGPVRSSGEGALSADERMLSRTAGELLVVSTAGLAGIWEVFAMIDEGLSMAEPPAL